MKKVNIIENFSLKKYNTFGVYAHARYFAEVKNEEQLRWLLTNPAFKDIKKLFLGEGSNILFVSDFDGLVIKISISNIELQKENEHYVWIKAGAGVIWHQLVEYCIDKKYYGLENLSLIPGTVGAAPIQNIGAYGVELKDSFSYLEAMNVETGEIKIFRKKDCKFGYRDSIFKNTLKDKYIVLKVVLRLNKKAKLNLKYVALKEMLDSMEIINPTITDISKAVIKLRSSKLPNYKELGNAGSFFKNPEIDIEDYNILKTKFPYIKGHHTKNKKVKISAALLIEKAGWKDVRKGDVGTHKKHALVIVNYDDAIGQEILNFANKIKAAVKAKFMIELESEVNIIKNENTIPSIS
ncbi:MAG: UDP-N-acetylmuramate dehydrogenase [Bacteroidetes bacterium]|nr:UDP-N-acetylmuramate dehydrogenase [Bacteroidota bacterium]